VLVKRFSKDEHVGVLRAALQRDRQNDDLRASVEAALKAVREGTGEWAKSVEPLVALFDARPASVAVLNDGIEKLVPVIRDGQPVQQRAAIAFVGVIAPKIRKASFAECVFVMMEMVAPEHPLEKALIDCIAKNMADVNVLAKVITLVLEEGAKRLMFLELLYTAVRESTPQKLALLQKVFAQKLAVLMIDPDTDVRRTTTRLFAEFQRKIPRDFRKSLKRFAPAQARLVELRADIISAQEKTQ
jgi:hypothetical protein